MSNEERISKKNLAYWAVTGLLMLNLFVSGAGALTQQQFLIDAMLQIGFPLYVMNILGAAYLLGALAVALPKRPLLKEWAYAGVIFAMTGAIASHISIGDSFANTAPSLILMALAITSYLLRPPSRRLAIQ